MASDRLDTLHDDPVRVFVLAVEQLMIDRCDADMRSTAPRGTRDERLAKVFTENPALCAADPWLAEVKSEHTVLGPSTLTEYEHELGAVLS